MAQDLTPRSEAALPAIDVREPSTLLFLPPWLVTQIEAVSDLGAGRTIVDTKTGEITGRVPTIPTSKMPTGRQRQAIERRVTELNDALRPGPLPKTLAIIGSLVTEHASARLDEDTADIKIDAYRDAVDDLPAWAIREAVRRWRRGDVPGTAAYDLDFAPKPARLRRVAVGIRDVALGQSVRLQRILTAEAEEPVTDDQRAQNVREAGKLIAKLAEPSANVVDTTLASARDPSLAADLEARRIKREAQETQPAAVAIEGQPA